MQNRWTNDEQMKLAAWAMKEACRQRADCSGCPNHTNCWVGNPVEDWDVEDPMAEE